MSELMTAQPVPDVCVPARPAGPERAAATGAERLAGRVARDVMTRDPDRVTGSDSLIEVAYTMRSLLVAFLPVCDQDGDLQGIIAVPAPVAPGHTHPILPSRRGFSWALVNNPPGHELTGLSRHTSLAASAR